jgi:predicted secreted protein
MATHSGSEGTVKIGSDVLAEIRSYTIESSGETIEDTTMGDSARTYKAGLTTFTASFEVYFDETDTAQNVVDPGTSITFSVYPEGDNAGDTFYTGSGIVTGRSITASFDGMVEMSLSVQGTGALTETTV